MNNRLVCGRLISIFLLSMLTILSCQPFDGQRRQYPSTIGTFQKTGDYTINPEMILASLDRGETNIFMPMLVTPNANTLHPPGSVRWTQSDYLKVANALSQYIWKETLEGWSTYYIAFDRACQNDLSGFDSVDLIYYKTIRVNWQKVYTARYIQIYPLANYVAWGGETNFPISEGWNAIDLTKYNITADEALQIAEENGGKEARSKDGNDCSISISIPDQNNDVRWDIGYYYGVGFEVIVDPYSGKHEISTPSP